MLQVRAVPADPVEDSDEDEEGAADGKGAARAASPRARLMLGEAE